MVADGRTPINNSLLDAVDWYIEQRQPGGRWEFDPLAECRKWYVVLITDGAESCTAYTRPDGSGGGYACDPGNAADQFANPGVSGVDPVPVFTIGFSETVASAPEELKCISDITDGEYFGARNASELKDALYGVLNQLNTTEERSFTPFKVSPPPSSKGAPATEQDFLVVYPLFQAKKDSSLWAGNLYGFKLNQNQTTLAADENCDIDQTTLVVEEVTGKTWDADARLTEQLGAASPERPVLMGQLDSITGLWSRHDLTEIRTDATLRLYLRNHMAVPAGVNDTEAQETVNFLRDIWQDDFDGVPPDPRAEPRPAGYPVFGDFYHSQPVIVNPPNRSMFYFDYGYGDAHDYASFLKKHAMRRRVVLSGANDGLLHAFDGGIYDRDRGSTTETYNDQHDLGNGQELFAYLPNAVMPRLYNMTYGKSQQYMVDGLIATSDVYIDTDPDPTVTSREWRTVAIATMRRGGRGMVALDITQPDPIDGTTFIPEVPTDQFPGCLNGGSGCGGDVYPKLLWEFEDVDDTDGNCPYSPATSVQCSPYWDLGWTWSKPAIARIAVYDASGTPDDVFVAFFGGGWDRRESDQTGNFIYGVDISTGDIVYKHNLGVAVPGSPSALDSDIDGFHDRIYFADSDGGIFRLQFPSPDDSAATGADAGTLTRIFDFRAGFAGGGFPDRQRFFTRPVMAPALFTSSGYTWALALGSGDRANLDRYDDVNNPIDNFFFVLDVGDDVTRGKADLEAVNYSDLTGDFDCTASESPLDPSVGNYGWYLSLRPNEKVVFDATVINGHILFPTFDPTPGEFAAHNVPDECIPVSPGTPTPTPTPNVAFGGEEVICKAAGIGRAYDLWFECGLGDYDENNDIYTGIEDYTIGGTTYVTFTTPPPDPDPTKEFVNVAGHVVTNWRQE
jgi:Tfp pilus tip-associated adhesin PilY1